MRIALLSSIMLLGLVAFGSNPASVLAQETPLAEDQKAVLVFDVRMDKMSDGELGKSLMNNLPPQDPNGPQAEDLVRIFGAASAPESVEVFEEMEPGTPLPMEFFVRMKFKNAEALTAQMDQMKAEGEEVEIGGKTYYKQTDENAPQGLLLQKIDDVTMEVGTEAYVTRSDRKVFTDGLNAAWKKVPNDAFRLAFDMEGSKNLMADVMDMGRQSIPPNFAAYVDLIGNAKDLRLSLDLNSKNLLTLSATGVDDDAAQELQEGLDSLLGFAKIGGQQAVGMLKQQDPEAADVVAEILDSLSAKVSGDQVEIAVPKPDGFDEAMQGMLPGGQ